MECTGGHYNPSVAEHDNCLQCLGETRRRRAVQCTECSRWKTVQDGNDECKDLLWPEGGTAFSGCQCPQDEYGVFVGFPDPAAPYFVLRHTCRSFPWTQGTLSYAQFPHEQQSIFVGNHKEMGDVWFVAEAGAAHYHSTWKVALGEWRPGQPGCCKTTTSAQIFVITQLPSGAYAYDCRHTSEQVFARDDPACYAMIRRSPVGYAEIHYHMHWNEVSGDWGPWSDWKARPWFCCSSKFPKWNYFGSKWFLEFMLFHFFVVKCMYVWLRHSTALNNLFVLGFMTYYISNLLYFSV